VITQSVRVAPRIYQLPAPSSHDSAVIRIRGDSITVDLAGATMEGTAVDSNPDIAAGVAIRVEGGTNIRILNAHIRGYNFGIEMYGSGEFRLHEIQKLRHYGFDDCYEQAHLTIDNFSAGHTRQAADIIVSFLDGVRRASGEAAVQREWRRVWRGYAAFSYFVEHKLVRQVTVPDTEAVADLVI